MPQVTSTPCSRRTRLRSWRKSGALLAANDLALDEQVEVFVVCRQQGRIVACAGLDHATIKCVAVAADLRGEALSLKLGSEVVKLAAERGQFHLFLYSAPAQSGIFPRLGVLSAGRGSGTGRPDGEQPGRDPEILRRPAQAAPAWREDRQHRDERQSRSRSGTAIWSSRPPPPATGCMCSSSGRMRRCSPMTTASRSWRRGSGHIANVTLHPGSDYIISRATFPGYFLKEIKDHRSQLGGDRPAPVSPTTSRRRSASRTAMSAPSRSMWSPTATTKTCGTGCSRPNAAAAAITVVELPRTTDRRKAHFRHRGQALLARRDFATIKELVPATTLQFLEDKFSEAVQTAP